MVVLLLLYKGFIAHVQAFHHAIAELVRKGAL